VPELEQLAEAVIAGGILGWHRTDSLMRLFALK
jgi:hypothetical protein